MSQENVELVRALIPSPETDLAALFRDESLFGQAGSGLDALIDPNIESVAVWQGGTTYAGVEGFRKMWLDWLEPWATYHSRVEEVIDAGDLVVVLVRDYARPHDADAEVELISGSVWEIRDSTIVRVQFFGQRAEALEAAGLGGQSMSQENVEIVRTFYSAWAHGDFPGPIELMDPEIEYVNPVGAVEPGTRRGLAAFSRAVGRVYEGWETWQMEPEEFRAVGDQVAVVVRYRARGRTSGAQAEGRESALWTLRDGKVSRYAWFHEPADALDAAGPQD